ncbi:FAD-dependent oxidoreductase [Secundilactobacillus mixtipabuli]|uniref:Fumarate reductase flavoprotein subunit n=1 Tax=Secundilactobacillus mixtipabuli TaxID=1435342 RepID=A0A1Z5IA58_9LACO|nr:FAD-dependent oxidoreductase [Secundilactobacillus mixtipabuli]GAW98501.1 fumarate reductase flavoprotein subunit [Secundilactobacillus mixtipabuli]
MSGYNFNVTKILDTEVLIVGAGNAGLMAATAAAEKGAKVTVIEKEDSINLMRVGLAGVGTNAQKRAGITINKYDLVEYLAAFAQHNVDEDLIYHWANHSAEAVNWVEDNILKPHGAHLRSEPDAMLTSSAYEAFPTENDPTVDDKTFTFYGEWIQEKVKEMGVTLKFKTPLVQLIKGSDGVQGVIVHDLTSNEYWQIKVSKGVILATGGYSANTELLKKWNPVALKKNVYNDSPRNDGAGIVSALDVGAIKDEEPAHCIFDRGLVPVGTKTEDMYVQTATYKDWLWLGSHPLLKVNLRGQRFSNESVPYQFIVNAASKQPGYLYAMIWDDNYGEYAKQFHMLGCARVGFPGYMASSEKLMEDTEQYVKKGLVVKADSIEELAKKLHLPVENLKITVKRNNHLVVDNFDKDFGKEPYRLTPVDKKPFYGCILGGRILCTNDGLRVNKKMQVLNSNYEPIRHLYAAGNDSGGFFFGSYPDRVPGLAASHAQTFGRLAGQAATEELDTAKSVKTSPAEKENEKTKVTQSLKPGTDATTGPSES